MRLGKYAPEVILREIARLPVEEFLGVCKILGIDFIEKKEEGEEKAKEFEVIWGEVCDKVNKLNKVRRKNLLKLLRAANKDR